MDNIHCSIRPKGAGAQKLDRTEQVEIKTLKDKEKELLREVLVKTRWNLEKTSRLLQIPLSQVKQKIREHGIKKPGSS